MKRTFGLLTVFAGACFALGSAALGSDIYVAQNSVGAGNGADAADAYSIAWLNSAGNWGTSANQVGPGTTVHLVGTFSTPLVAAGSGVAGSPITIHFEPNAKFSAPTLPPNSQWINIGGLSYIIIDGGVNGLIQLTDNGTMPANGGTCDYANGNIGGVYAFPMYNCTIENLTISNMYNRQTNTEGIIGNEDGYAIYWTGTGLTVSNCYLTGCQDMISGVYGNPANSNLTVVGCTLTNFNHGITVGCGGIYNPYFYNVSITHNFIEGGDMFETADSIPDIGFHRDDIFFFDDSPDTSGSVSNVTIAYNYIRQGFQPYSHRAGSGAMYFGDITPNMAVHVRVYNNVSTLVYPLVWSGGGGMIFGFGTDVLVANNTAVAWNTNGHVGGTDQISISGLNCHMYNNICVSLGGASVSTFLYTNGLVNSPATTLSAFNSVWLDYNIYNYQSPNSFYEVVFSTNSGSGTWEAGLVDNLPQWNGLFSSVLSAHFDPHSSSSPVKLDSNLMPLAIDTVAVGNGTNLTSWGITNDYAGNPRPATGNWTIGAYQVTDSSTTTPFITGSVAASSSSGGGSSSSGGSTLPAAAGITNFITGTGSSDIRNGLLLQYSLNQVNGTSVVDASGNGNSGTLTGHATWTNGLAGASALAFPSNDGLFSSSDGIADGSLSYTGDWTLTFWVKNSSFPGAANYAATTASGTGFTVGPSAWGFYDGTTTLGGNVSMATNAWYFIAVSKSGGVNYQLYINGVANSSGTLNNVNISSLMIGDRNGNFGMNGCMSDFRIYTRVLAASEVTTLCNNGPNDIAASLIPTVTGVHFGQ